MRLMPILFALVLCLAPAASAGASPKPPKAGRITRIECRVAAHQSYALYVPKRYKPDRAWPILYCFAPNADGEHLVKRFSAVAEELGWIVAGSLTARNGPSEPNDRAWREMLRDTEARLRLDGTKRVACGFSGAAWVASRMAYGRPERFGGVILLGQGLDPGIKVDGELAVAMIMGDKERRLHELEDVKALCSRHDIPGFFETFPGDHRLPPDTWLSKALRWHDATWNTRYAGCDDTATRRVRAALARRIDAAEVLAGAGKPAHALVALRQARDGFRSMTVATRQDVEARIAELEKAPEVANEAKAQKALVKLVARDRKLASRKRGLLAKKYEKLAATYPQTPSADIATETASFIKQVP